jgi:branched-chain amino acid transport system ATP-binding protein
LTSRWPAWAWPRPSAWCELLLRLKPHHAMMLVEHDIDAIFALADHLTVMVNGTVIASGEPAAIRADRGVQAAYLGEEH